MARSSDKRLRRALVALLLAAALALAACGSSGSVTILNTEKVEQAIQQSSLEQRGAHVQVTCPSGVHQQKGLQFSCTAVNHGVTTRFVVTQQDGSGQVHYIAP